MPEWLPLHALACAPGREGRAIARLGRDLVLRPQFLADVSAWQATFAAQPGQGFALYFEDDAYQFAAALYGAWHAGKTVYLPGNRQPATVQRLLPRVDGCAGQLPGALARMPPAADEVRHPLDPRRTRLVVYTSGSGGEPLAIDKCLAQLDAEVTALQACFGAGFAGTAPEVCSTVSHQHIYGLLFQVLWPLAAGRVFVNERILYPEQMAAGLGGRPTVLVSSPAHLRRLPATLDGEAVRANLQAVFSSGGPLPDEAARHAAAVLGRAPAEVFGSSETGGIAWRERARHGERWQPLPGVEWRIDDGQLAVRSPHLPDDAWWRTSDRVAALAEGGFALLGRVDRIVKIEEKRVSLSAIEAALMALPDIAEARALVLPAGGADRVAVVAVPTPAGRALLDRIGRRAFGEHLRDGLAGRIEPVSMPRRWRHVAALPVDAQGKSTQASLAALFRGRMPAVAWRHRAPDTAGAVLEVAADLAVFDGHFAGLPVLPGVAQLDWAITLGRECFPLPPRFLRAEALKFHKPVLPPATLELDLQWDAVARRLGFRLGSALGAHASGRIVFGEEA